jgi:hypothetical protein
MPVVGHFRLGRGQQHVAHAVTAAKDAAAKDSVQAT